jgi:hypothetical protein
MKISLLLIILLCFSCNAKKFELAKKYVEKLKSGNLKKDTNFFYKADRASSEFDNRQMSELIQCSDKYYITTKKYSGNFEIVYNFKCDKVKSHFDKDTVSKIIFLFHSIPKWKTKIRIIQGNFVILK